MVLAKDAGLRDMDRDLDHASGLPEAGYYLNPVIGESLGTLTVLTSSKPKPARCEREHPAMLENSTPRPTARLKPTLPRDEEGRLASLYFLNILDGPPEEAFDRITRIALQLFSAPVATISFVDANRDWIKSSLGFEGHEIPRAISFSSYTILSRETLVVPDTKLDLRFFDHPLVRGPNPIRFYAGCPIQAWNGANIGALGIMDVVPRSFTASDEGALRDLVASIEHEIGIGELRLVDELTDLLNERGLRLIAEQIVHRARRNGEVLSMLFLDIKGLDELNSRFGRSFGDSALTMVGDVLRETLRNSDVPARMRVNDFAVLLPDTGEPESSIVVSRIMRALEARKVDALVLSNLSLRISQATLDPSAENFSLEGLIAHSGVGS